MELANNNHQSSDLAENIPTFDVLIMLQTKIIQPSFLKQGDSVGIVAPARKISEQELLPAIKTLQGWGLKVKLGKHIYATHNQFAGTDDIRRTDMQSMLDDADVKAIF